MATEKIKPIEAFVLAGVCRQVERALDLKPNSVSVRTRAEAYDTWVAKRDKAPAYPAAFLTYGSVATSNRYRENVLARGVVNPEGKDKRFGIAEIPLVFTMQLEFYTDDFLRSLTFLSDINFARVYSLLDFNLNYRDIAHTIQVEVAGDITVPQKDVAGPGPAAFAFVVDLTVHGFVSSAAGKYDVKRATGQKLVFQCRLDVGDAPNGDLLFETTITE